MTDRSLSRDMAAHAARTAGQPELRQQLAEVLHRHQPTSRYDGTGRTECLCGAQVRMFDQHQAEVTAAVVQPLLDAQRAEADAWRERHDRYATAHRQLLARAEQLRFAVRSGALLLRSTAERHQTGQPIAAATLRAAAKDLDDMAAEKDPT